MKLPFFLAKRFLFSKYLPAGINLISIVAIMSIATGTAVLIIVLSVFNGLGALIEDVFGKIDPDLKITAKHGKYLPESLGKKIQKKLQGKAVVFEVLENRAVLKKDNIQKIVTLTGIPKKMIPYLSREIITLGNFALHGNKQKAFALLGSGVAYDLQISPTLSDTLEIFAIDEKKEFNNENALRYGEILPAGIFSVQAQYDNNIVFTHKIFAENLFNLQGKTSSLYLWISNKKISTEEIITELKPFRPEFNLLTRNEQHADLFKVLKNEKFIAYLLLVFVLILVSFNILIDLGIIILSKKNAIALLFALGMPQKKIKRIFLIQGILLGGIAWILGMFGGITFVFLQKKYGFLTLGDTNSFIIDAMPVKIQTEDIFLLTLTVLAIIFISTWIPVKNITSSPKMFKQ